LGGEFLRGKAELSKSRGETSNAGLGRAGISEQVMEIPLELLHFLQKLGARWFGDFQQDGRELGQQ
jgi:hypothetical protein